MRFMQQGHVYLEGSVLFIQRTTGYISQAEDRIILADDVSSMNEAMELAASLGIRTVQRALYPRKRIGTGWPR